MVIAAADRAYRRGCRGRRLGADLSSSAEEGPIPLLEGACGPSELGV
jgi:hypothetical protein